MHRLSVYSHCSFRQTFTQSKSTDHIPSHSRESEVFPGQLRYSDPSGRLWIYSGFLSVQKNLHREALGKLTNQMLEPSPPDLFKETLRKLRFLLGVKFFIFINRTMLNKEIRNAQYNCIRWLNNSK